MPSGFEATLPIASIAWMENENIPPCVGVPWIAPVAEESVSPGGRVPLLIDHVYGNCPPEAVTTCEYCVPTAPFGSVFVTICTSPCGPIKMVRIFEADRSAASVARTVMVYCPFTVGTPLIPPLGESVSPGG